MKIAIASRISLLLLAGGILFGSCGQKPIRVGFIGGLSGFNADLGISGRNGVSLAISAINKAGGIHGRKLELLVRDDKQDPETAPVVFQELVSEQVVAVIGPMTSAIAQVLIPLANTSRIPLISPSASSPEFSGIDDMFIRVVTPNVNESLGLAQESFQRGARKACVIDDLSNQAFSKAMVRTYTAELRRLAEEKGKEIAVVALPFDPKDSQGMQTILIGLARYQPDIVLFATNSLDTALLAQGIRKKGFTMPFLGTGWSMSQTLIENGGSAVEGMAFTVPFNPNSEAKAWKEFSELYKETFGKPADFGAHQGWNAVQVLAGAIAQGGTRNIKEHIINTQYQGLQSSFVIDAFGDPVIPFQRLEISSGKLVAHE
jgi:branched-chain amino acid transport system substrate-binding protein